MEPNVFFLEISISIPNPFKSKYGKIKFATRIIENALLDSVLKDWDKQLQRSIRHISELIHRSTKTFTCSTSNVKYTNIEAIVVKSTKIGKRQVFW